MQIPDDIMKAARLAVIAGHEACVRWSEKRERCDCDLGAIAGCRKMNGTIARAIMAAEQRGENRGLERAAKAADEERASWDTESEFDDGWNGSAVVIATAIRAMITKD